MSEPTSQRVWHLLTGTTRLLPPRILAMAARVVPPPLRVGSSARFVAMRHPFRSYSTHLVLVARRPLPDIGAEATVEEWQDLLDLTRELAARHGIASPALVTNFGRFQAVRQLHFHLVPGEEFAPLHRRRLLFGACCLGGDAETVELAIQAIVEAGEAARRTTAARLFLLEADGREGSRPVVAIEDGGVRHA